MRQSSIPLMGWRKRLPRQAISAPKPNGGRCPSFLLRERGEVVGAQVGLPALGQRRERNHVPLGARSKPISERLASVQSPPARIGLEQSCKPSLPKSRKTTTP